MVIALCGCSAAPPAEDLPICEGHDGGGGACVAVGACSDGFTLDGAGRCARWRAVGGTGAGNRGSIATRLEDGRILVLGGQYLSGFVSTDAEIFDPTLEQWSPVQNPDQARIEHVALALPDGRVLVAGGNDGELLRTDAALYDPVADAWNDWPDPINLRSPAGFVDDAGIVHLVGEALDGSATDGLALDPSGGTTSTEPGFVRPRGLAAIHVLTDGRAVAVGGVHRGANGYSVPVDAAEVRDPASGIWTIIDSSPAMERIWFASGRVDGDRVLVAGGSNGYEVLNSTRVVDAAARRLHPDDGLPAPLHSLGAASLASGAVLLVGGIQVTVDETTASSAAFEMRGDDETIALPDLPRAVARPFAVELLEGGVLVGGAEESWVLERGAD